MDRTISRRQALASLGTASLAAVLAGCGEDEQAAVTNTAGDTATVQAKTAPASATAAEFESAATCQVAAESTEGPYYFDVDAIRSDIREDREGTLLRLGVRVRDAGSCEPIDNALVDVWHCDATGNYSGFESASQGGPGGGGRTDEETYLRGAQATNADGIAEFKTIYPGWYPGRATHIHLKVHLDRTTVLTTQVFTNREFDAQVWTAAPYEQGQETFNEADGFYSRDGELTLSRDGDAARGVITLDVQRA